MIDTLFFKKNCNIVFFFCLSSSARTYAVVGNGEDGDTESTPIRSPEKVPNIINWNFKSDSASDNKAEVTHIGFYIILFCFKMIPC